MLKKVIIENKYQIGNYEYNVGIYARCGKGEKYYSNFVTVGVVEDGRKYIVELQLMLSLDVRQMYPELPACVKLTGSSILSIDIHLGTHAYDIGIIYAIVKHAIYTQDSTILAYYDIN